MMMMMMRQWLSIVVSMIPLVGLGAEPQQTNLAASAELVCAIRQLETDRGTNSFKVLKEQVAAKTRDLIASKGFPSFGRAEHKFQNDAYPTKVEVYQDRIEVTESGCIWKLAPVITDGKVSDIRVTYTEICDE